MYQCVLEWCETRRRLDNHKRNCCDQCPFLTKETIFGCLRDIELNVETDMLLKRNLATFWCLHGHEIIQIYQQIGAGKSLKPQNQLAFQLTYVSEHPTPISESFHVLKKAIANQRLTNTTKCHQTEHQPTQAQRW